MNKSNNIWIVSLKVILMSVFATICSFMLNCFVVAVASENFNAGGAAFTRVLIQVIGIIVQFVFIYGTIWDCADTDRQQKALRIKDHSAFKGVLIGLISAIPYYLMAVAMMLMTFKLIPDITGLLRVLSSQFWGFYTFLLPVATSTTPNPAGPTFAQSTATPIQAICACFVPTIIPLLAHIPYTLGRRGIILGEKLIFAKKKK